METTGSYPFSGGGGGGFKRLGTEEIGVGHNRTIAIVTKEP